MVFFEFGVSILERAIEMLAWSFKNPTEMETDIQLIKSENNIDYYRFSAENPKREKAGQITLQFSVPSAGSFSSWNPLIFFDRRLRPNWRMTTARSRIASGAPVQQIIGMGDQNVLNIAVLDAAGPIEIKSGISEETAELVCRIEFFAMPVTPFAHYETVIRIDRRSIPYYDVLTDVRNWWREAGGYVEAATPETVFQPVNSIWYSFHQAIDVDKIVQECARSAALGMGSVIIDDGWQTEDNNRGYAYCGDWEVAKAKIPDMAEFVRRVHETGLKFMIWYSVPFVGIYAKNFERFKGKMLDFNGRYGSLDPRYPEVREYLIETYEKAVRDWNLDGLKLDFIDSFHLPENQRPSDPGRDLESLEEAVELLLREIKRRLTAINPDICIEFRQSYIGPVAATCANMLRVMDCPADPLLNRVGGIDLRLLSGKAAVHSDMLMWDPGDTPENAALQLINVLFCVPQISMVLETLPKAHDEMLKFYLGLWNRYCSVLQTGKLVAENPEANYSLVSAEKDGTLFAVSYAKNTLFVKPACKEVVWVNGTGGQKLILEKENACYTYEVFDCMGHLLQSGTAAANQCLQAFTVPNSGVLMLHAV